jgi:glycolate oxidase iron-sulfur subunit
MQPRAVTDAVWIIRAMGHRVVIPDDQACCGAPHRHAGDERTADDLCRRNARAFSELSADRIVFLSTGCGMTLHEDRHELAVEPMEICAWIESALAGSDARLMSVTGHASIHRPCSARHTGDDPDSARRLLEAIPDLRVSLVPEGPGCCGAAGSYMIDQGEIADRLGRETLACIAAGSVPVTPNLGCAMQIAVHAGRDEPALHPVTVLRMALDGGGSIH